MREFNLPKKAQFSGWANGQDNNYDPGEGGHEEYGDHPFVIAKLKSNQFVGLYFKNSNAKLTEMEKHKGDQTVVEFKTTGGQLDFFFFH